MTPTPPPPAGGAEISQVIGASAAAAVLMIALLFIGMAHRSGRITWLGRLADWAGAIGGTPGYVAIPAALAGISLVGAAFGFYWDVSLHIDNGRDPGPLANPSHYFILLGLFGIFAAGWLALVLPKGDDRPGPAPVKITRNWYAPLGGVVLMAAASFALTGFPLDDISHRIFGQDVTLWGPTHLMMLTGAAVSLIGILMLLTEGRSNPVPSAPTDGLGKLLTRHQLSPAITRWIRVAAASGGFLIALSIYQAEFDYGVPQFRLLFDPVLVAFAAGAGLVTARAMLGKGGALVAAVFFIGLRLILLVVVTGILGETVAHFPLYLAEAVLVEGAALALGTDKRYRFALVSGVLIGTIGIVAEMGWTHVWAAIVWPAHILPSAMILAVVTGIAGAVLGAFVSGGLQRRVEVVGSPRTWAAAGLSIIVFAGVIGFLLQTNTVDSKAIVTLEDASPPPNRTVNATLRFSDDSVVQNPDWLNALAWQGQDKLVNVPLVAAGDGTYKTSAPLPVYGSWKTMLRFHQGNILSSVPVWLPEDAAIPAPEVPATASFTRPFQDDHSLMQREVRQDVPTWLWTTAGVVVLTLSMVLFLLVGWSLVRVARGGSPERKTSTAPASPGRPAVA
ncbi:MAG: hypothetical protein QOG62_648 [Thermoleophilaceae bacterium]|nr:hypothetical protein [Thermoleophilaceae bacterium]